MGDINLLGSSQDKKKDNKQKKFIEMTDPKKQKEESHYNKKPAEKGERFHVGKPSAFDRLFGSKDSRKKDFHEASGVKTTSPKKEPMDVLYRDAKVDNIQSTELPSAQDNRVFTPNKILEGSKKKKKIMTDSEKEKQKAEKSSWIQKAFSRKETPAKNLENKEVTGKGLSDEILQSLEQGSGVLPEFTPSLSKRARSSQKKTSTEKESDFGDGLDVNLVPESFVRQPQERMRSLIYVSIASVFLVFIIYGGFIVYETILGRTNDNVAEEIQKLDVQILGYQKVQSEAKAVKEHIDATEYLLDTHVYWSRFLYYLEQYTLEDVYYLEISGDARGRVSLRAVADNYQTIGEQLLRLEHADDFLSSVAIREGSVYEEPIITDSDENSEINAKVTFDIDLTVLPEVFYFSSDTQ